MVEQEWTLTASDRCDVRKCGARAFVRTVDPVTWFDILWCGHHFRQVESKILEREFSVFDERGQLDVKLDASA